MLPCSGETSHLVSAKVKKKEKKKMNARHLANMILLDKNINQRSSCRSVCTEKQPKILQARGVEEVSFTSNNERLFISWAPENVGLAEWHLCSVSRLCVVCVAARRALGRPSLVEGCDVEGVLVGAFSC